MLFRYKAVTKEGKEAEGTIEAASKDTAISSLQRRGLVIVSIKTEEEAMPWWKRAVFERVPSRDIVVLSRQIATLFEAQVSALRVFQLLASGTENRLLARRLSQVAGDIQAGSSISDALAKHPNIFSNFYVNMVRAGEEAGKLDETFNYLAEYLQRQHELSTRTKNALIYPAFVILTFIVVMVLMFVMVIPKLSEIIVESGQEIPFYTKIVIGISNFFVNYGVFLLIFIILLVLYLIRRTRTERGRAAWDSFKLSIPVIGDLYKKLYLSRIADNLDTMLTSGVAIVRAIEITSTVVGSATYEKILKAVTEDVKGGSSLSDAFRRHEDIPPIMNQMVEVGEETGALGSILKTMAGFYRRELNSAVDTMVGLIEPLLIVILGVGVGILLASILIPIYNIAGGIT